jgi:ABC-type spermidine/putrescine transport system permease subunit II
MKMTVLEESADFTTLEKKLFSQLKSHELSINVILIMIFLLLISILLLVIVLVVMMLTPLKDWRRRSEEGE